MPGRSYGLAIARRLGLPDEVVRDAEARVPDAERNLDALLAAVETRQRELAERTDVLEQRALEAESLAARLAAQDEAQVARDTELRRREKEAERRAREQARAFLLEARQRVEEALGAARGAADDAAAREARRLVEEGIRVEGEALAAASLDEASEAVAVDQIRPGQRVRVATGSAGDVLEVRGDGRLVVRVGGMRMVVDAATATPVAAPPAPKRSAPTEAPAGSDARIEIDLRGMTGDEAEAATLAAVDAAVLAEYPCLRIIHGMGTGVVRERVRRVLGHDRRVRELRLRRPQPGWHRRHHRGARRMSMIPEEIIEQVRESADVIGIISESVELKRTGADWRGPCPFHGGKNRNFAVIPKKGLFYCYKCHEAGDVFSYLMKRFGMDYPTAVRDVARRSGIVIPERAAQAGPDPNEPLYGAVSAAHDWFVRQLAELPEARTARDYLAERAITPEQTAELMLGYAPRGSAGLEAMRTLGIGEPVLLKAGLAARREDGSVVPRFRGRLIFPIHDQRGRIVAFGGRLLGPGEPKYLNSPESDIFRKGRTLYNLHAARHAIRREDSAILVEGYSDVIRLVLAGVENVVAPLGTALTHEQAALIKRFAPAATLLYDSDQAGLKATFRAGDELLRHDVRVKVATMPPGEDPDSLVRKGGLAALQPILADAVDVLGAEITAARARADGSRTSSTGGRRSIGCCPRSAPLPTPSRASST